MATEPLRIGVIGVSFGALVQIPGLQAEGWDVVAVCSRREERAQKAAAESGIAHVYTDYRRMLERDDLDAVSIVTPPAVHREMALEALRAGKHVLCEKPFALDRAEGREMLEAAQETGLTAMINHEFRLSPQRSYVKELLEQGYIGRFHLAVFQLLVGPQDRLQPKPTVWQTGASTGGGFLGALGSHYIDAMRHWLGEPVSVNGRTRTLYPDLIDQASGETLSSDADDFFSFTAAFAGGGYGTMTGSNAAPYGPGGRLELFGTDGYLFTPQPGVNPMPDGVVYGAKAGDGEVSELPMPERHHPFDDPTDRRSLPFRRLLREFRRGITEGTSPAPNFADGYRCQLVLDAIRESSQTGRWVEVPPE